MERKSSSQRFVFENGDYQDYPNFTERDDVTEIIDTPSEN